MNIDNEETESLKPDSKLKINIKLKKKELKKLESINIKLFSLLISFIFFILTTNDNVIYKTKVYQNNNFENTNKYPLQKYKDDCIKGIKYDKKIYKRKINIKVSVIIIFYNEEKNLLRVIRSIQNQNMKEIEIILINDCSNDNSLKIAKKLRQSDKRIKIFSNKKNMGTHYSRALGCRKSKGEYIMQIDSDDFYFPDIIERSYNILKSSNIDFGQFQYIRGHNKVRQKVVSSLVTEKNEIIYPPNIIEYRKFMYNRMSHVYLWNKIIKRDLLNKVYDIIGEKYINNHQVYAEDWFISFILFREAKSFIYINELGYFYSSNPKSLCRRKKTPAKKALHENSILNTIEGVLEKSISDSDYQLAFKFIFRLNYYSNYIYEYEKAKKIYEKYLNNKHYDSAQKKRIKSGLENIYLNSNKNKTN